MTPAERFKFVELERMKFFKSIYVAWRRVLQGQADLLIEKLTNNPGIINNIENEVHSNKQDIEEIFIKTWQLTGVKFASLTYNEYHKSISFAKHVKGNGLFDDYWGVYMENYALNEAGQRIPWINETTDAQLLNTVRKSLASGHDEGESIYDIAKRIKRDIKGEYYDLSDFRAQRIARTEIIGASNRGSLLGAQSLGYNMRKQWISTIDQATRRTPYDHARSMGEVVGINDKFIMTGEALDHPGDPKGSSGNIINCRCTSSFTVI